MDLRTLQEEYMKAFRQVTREKLQPGALIETNFTEEEIIIRDGRHKKPKIVIIIGNKQQPLCRLVLQSAAREGYINHKADKA